MARQLCSLTKQCFRRQFYMLMSTLKCVVDDDNNTTNFTSIGHEFLVDHFYVAATASFKLNHMHEHRNYRVPSNLFQLLTTHVCINIFYTHFRLHKHFKKTTKYFE